MGFKGVLKFANCCPSFSGTQGTAGDRTAPSFIARGFPLNYTSNLAHVHKIYGFHFLGLDKPAAQGIN